MSSYKWISDLYGFLTLCLAYYIGLANIISDLGKLSPRSDINRPSVVAILVTSGRKRKRKGKGVN